MELNIFKSSNGSDTITYYHFKPDGEINHVVQIIHGMSEHIGRYEGFADYLNQHGIAVLGHDHMAHGKSVATQKGEFIDKKQAKFMVDDAHLLNKIIKKEYPNLPITVFCHSMGSFVGRIMAATYPNDMDKIIVCGTAGKNILAPIGKYIAFFLEKVISATHKSELINKLSFGAYNKHFKDAKTNFDWLSSDPAEVEKYINDPDCGFLFSVTGSTALTDLLITCNKESTFKNTDSNLPIFIISGAEDPVSNFGKGAHEVFANYQKAGCTKSTLTLYPNVRHEIILDRSKDQVWHDILEF
ncbi:MAG: alpha/beta hydrolase, partial [Eubacteriales bacterium]